MRQIAATWPVRRHVTATAFGTGQLGRVGAVHATLLCVAGCLWATAVLHVSGQEAASSESTESESTEDAAAKKLPAMLEPDKGWLRVTKDYEVWIDFEKKQVIAGGRICLREGPLEMFACPKGTREHESIVSVHTPARYVHAALVALGARPGPAVQFEPTYKPAQGTEVAVEVLWRDEHGKDRRVKAQEWIKHVKTGKELESPWVFAGSGFWTDEEGKEQFYYGDGGEFVCVSNFSTATLDLPVESSAANDTLLFAAFTERIPPRDTPVMLILTPKLEKPGKDAEPKEPAAKQELEKTESAKAKPNSTEPEKAAASTPADTKTPTAEPAKTELSRAPGGARV